jgi:hypothetical protein
VAHADAAANAEAKEASIATTIALSLAEPPAPGSVKNEGAPTKLDAPATLAPPPSSDN